MTKSKKAVKAEQPVLDLLVEASGAAALLITRRRRLFRAGGSVFVGELLRKDGKTHGWRSRQICLGPQCHD